MKKLKRLSERTKTLLFSAHSATMEERYFEIEENLYVGEGLETLDFCKWIDKEIGGCSQYNIDMLFKAYKGDVKYIKEAMVLKIKIQEIKNLTN